MSAQQGEKKRKAEEEGKRKVKRLNVDYFQIPNIESAWSFRVPQKRARAGIDPVPIWKDVEQVLEDNPEWLEGTEADEIGSDDDMDFMHEIHKDMLAAWEKRRAAREAAWVEHIPWERTVPTEINVTLRDVTNYGPWTTPYSGNVMMGRHDPRGTTEADYENYIKEKTKKDLAAFYAGKAKDAAERGVVNAFKPPVAGQPVPQPAPPRQMSAVPGIAPTPPQPRRRGNDDDDNDADVDWYHMDDDAEDIELGSEDDDDDVFEQHMINRLPGGGGAAAPPARVRPPKKPLSQKQRQALEDRNATYLRNHYKEGAIYYTDSRTNPVRRYFYVVNSHRTVNGMRETPILRNIGTLYAPQEFSPTKFLPDLQAGRGAVDIVPIITKGKKLNLKRSDVLGASEIPKDATSAPFSLHDFSHMKHMYHYLQYGSGRQANAGFHGYFSDRPGLYTWNAWFDEPPQREPQKPSNMHMPAAPPAAQTGLLRTMN